MNKYSNLPLVSVCISVYGRAEFLSLCLNSVINQSYKNLEIIIIYTECNDGGKSLNICEYFKRKDSRIKIIKITKNEYPFISDTLNIGYNAASGVYISSVDSDDYIDFNCIQDCVTHIQNFGLIYTYCNLFGNVNTKDSRALYLYSKENLLKFFMVFHFRLFLKTAWNNIDSITSCNYYFDYDLVLRLSEVTDFILLAKPLYYWRRHENIQITSFKNIEENKKWKIIHINNAKKRRGLL